MAILRRAWICLVWLRDGLVPFRGCRFWVGLAVHEDAAIPEMASLLGEKATSSTT